MTLQAPSKFKPESLSTVANASEMLHVGMNHFGTTDMQVFFAAVSELRQFRDTFHALTRVTKNILAPQENKKGSGILPPTQRIPKMGKSEQIRALATHHGIELKVRGERNGTSQVSRDLSYVIKLSAYEQGITRVADTLLDGLLRKLSSFSTIADNIFEAAKKLEPDKEPAIYGWLKDFNRFAADLDTSISTIDPSVFRNRFETLQEQLRVLTATSPKIAPIAPTSSALSDLSTSVPASLDQLSIVRSRDILTAAGYPAGLISGIDRALDAGIAIMRAVVSGAIVEREMLEKVTQFQLGLLEGANVIRLLDTPFRAALPIPLLMRFDSSYRLISRNHDSEIARAKVWLAGNPSTEPAERLYDTLQRAAAQLFDAGDELERSHQRIRFERILSAVRIPAAMALMTTNGKATGASLAEMLVGMVSGSDVAFNMTAVCDDLKNQLCPTLSLANGESFADYAVTQFEAQARALAPLMQLQSPTAPL